MSSKSASATVAVDASSKQSHAISRYITGKFCEHLGSNIYNGMEAQILRNPTFYDMPFGGAGTPPDGGAGFVMDAERIAQNVAHKILRTGGSEEYVARMIAARDDALAFSWVQEPDGEAVRVSPDAGPYFGGKAGRAQRIEPSAAGAGISQLVHLPLHRTRRYEWRIVARSVDIKTLAIGLEPDGDPGKAATAELSGLTAEWGTFTGELVIGDDAPAEGLYKFSLTAPGAGNLVIDRALLYPADHVNGADPDVIRLLAGSRLPVLRWPGGNFVSGYDWQDGIGPIDARPTRPNPAWGGVETNIFGTDEFVTFCRAVGCEPMICINAGDGTAAEAAAWVEYCNGPADSEWGAKRAAGGNSEPYSIRIWEIGNELTGRHQVGWTTPEGYADRYGRFAAAMLAADETILLQACGGPAWWGEPWNKRLIEDNAAALRCVTDHILVGGQIDPASDPSDVCRDFMSYVDAYEKIYSELRDRMIAGGVAEPRMSITELQLFGRIARTDGSGGTLTRESLVAPDCMAEAVYDALVYHMCVRLNPFIEMVTQSATVNHGGGLRKQKERVYANPCHWGQSMFREMADATPVAVEVASPSEKLACVLTKKDAFKIVGDELAVIDAVAAVDEGGDLLVSLIHRGVDGPVGAAVSVAGFDASGEAEVTTLSADAPWSRNTLEVPDAIEPVRSSVPAEGGVLTVDMPPCSVALVRFRPA